MTYITDHKWKNYRSWDEVPESVRPEFDWMDRPEEGTFLMYRNQWYALEEFMRCGPDTFDGCPIVGHGYASDSYFSGVVIELDAYGDQYRIATYINQEAQPMTAYAEYKQAHNSATETMKAHIMNTSDIPEKWRNDTLARWDVIKVSAERLVSESVTWQAIEELRDSGHLPTN